MTFFETKGIDFQYNAKNIMEANRNFAYSCNRCATTGRQIDCNKCSISQTHDLMVEYFKIKKGA